MQKISYTVDNGRITIVGNYWEGTHDRAMILLHMMPATKESWSEVAEQFHQQGYDVVAIDLRGHGESSGDYTRFNETEHRASIRDVEGARVWLMNHGVIPGTISIAGASIGANLALEFLVAHPESKAAVCISAGLNYQGIETLPLVRRLAVDQRVLFIVAKDDPRVKGAHEQTATLFDATAADKELKVFETGGHGTDIFKAHPESIKEAIGWIQKDVRI
jgi:pimeloyl-ACP methyl ester carboxylesterase